MTFILYHNLGMAEKYSSIFSTVFHPSFTAEVEGCSAMLSLHYRIIFGVPVEMPLVIPAHVRQAKVELSRGQAGDCLWDAPLLTSSKLRITMPSPHSHPGLPLFWNCRVSKLFKRNFHSNFPHSQRLPESIHCLKKSGHLRLCLISE